MMMTSSRHHNAATLLWLIVCWSSAVTNVTAFAPLRQQQRRQHGRRRVSSGLSVLAGQQQPRRSSSPRPLQQLGVSWKKGRNTNNSRMGSSSHFSSSPYNFLAELQSLPDGEASEGELDVGIINEEEQEVAMDGQEDGDVEDEEAMISIVEEEDEEETTESQQQKRQVVDDDDFDDVGGEGSDPTTVNSLSSTEEDGGTDEDEDLFTEEELELRERDSMYMQMAVTIAQAGGGERGPSSAYPNPTTGALLVSPDGRVLGEGRSSYDRTAIHAVLEDAGLSITPLREWCVTWPASSKLRDDLARATLYLTLEPDAQRRGQAHPPLTQLIELSGVRRVVIGAASPIPEEATQGAQTLHQAGLDVSMGPAALDGEAIDACLDLIDLYTERATSKLQRMARKHRQLFHRPLGFLHCSVVDSDDIEAFAQHGNAFGKNFGGKTLSFRDFGSYEIAPPPEQIWADDQEEADDFYDDDDEGEKQSSAMMALDFEDEDEQEPMGGTPVMPWYAIHWRNVHESFSFWPSLPVGDQSFVV
jgi:pyrimidine deaminase RibD-like protein